MFFVRVCDMLLQGGAVCVLQCVTVLRIVRVREMLKVQCGAVRCSVVQCGAVRCSVLRW